MTDDIVGSRRVGALKRLALAIVWIPVAVVIVFPVALLAGGIHVLLVALATVTTIGALKLNSIFWSVFWDLSNYGYANSKYVLGVGIAEGPHRPGFSVLPSFSATGDKIGGS